MRRLPLFLGLLVFLLSAETAAAEQFAVIVNAANGTAQLDSKAVKAHFLKTQASWSAGDRVRPVDQSDATAKRAAFLEKVLGMTAAELDRHWLERQYATGDAPPAKAPDDATVIKLVKTFKGAIGFVSKEAAETAGVKVVLTVNY